MSNNTLEPFKAAVIGAGRIGLSLEADPKRPKPSSHSGTWLLHPRTELVALCDPNPNLVNIAADIAPDARCYDDARTLLDEEKPEIVSIASHQDTHVELATLALEAGVKAVVCEKPLSDDLSKAKDLVRAAERAGASLIVNHARRFDPSMQALSKRLQDGLIGEILQVTGYYVYGLQSTGTHLVDLIRLLLTPLTGEITSVIGIENKKEPFHPPGDPCLDALIEFESGTMGAIQSLNMKDYDFFEVTIFGRLGKVTVSDRGQRIETYIAKPATSRTGFTDIPCEADQVETTDAANYFALMGNHVIDCLDGKATPASTGEDSYKALAVLNAIRESAEKNSARIEVAQGAS